MTTTVATVIARQVELSGHVLLRGMEPLDPAEFFAENRDGLSAAWVTGHLACFADLFSSWLDPGGQLLLDGSFHQVFNETDVAEAGPVSKAASVDPAVYPKTLLLHRFREAVVKAQRVLGEFDIAQWDAPAPPDVPLSLRTCGAVWEILGGHINWHLGGLASSMPRFDGTYTLGLLPHHLYVRRVTR